MSQEWITPGDEGVSEALGFMLIFAMVIIGIGLVTLYGYPMLIQQQTSADEQIMEKNMIVLQNDVKSLAYKAVPYKETALKIGGGTLFLNPPTSDVTAPAFGIWDDTTGAGNPWVTDYRPGDLRYESTSAQADISLQSGAVVMRKKVEPGSVMLSEPRWYYDDLTNTWVINLIALNNTDILSRSGIGTVEMKMISSETLPAVSTINVLGLPAGTDVYIKYDPGTSTQDYSVAWHNFFINTLKVTSFSSCSPTATCYVLPISAANAGQPINLVIKKNEITVKSL